MCYLLSEELWHLQNQTSNSHLVEQLNHAGLDGTYWAGVLKTKLNITLAQQIQYLDETHLLTLKCAARHDWEEKALKKFLGITASAANATAARGDLVDKLTEAGLDGDYWRDVFETRLGITRLVQTESVGMEVLEILKEAWRHKWEETALRKIFGISDETHETALEKRQELYKQKQQDSKQLLEEVKELKEKDKNYKDKMMGKMNQLRQCLDVAEEQWVEKYDDKNLAGMSEQLEKLAEGRPVNFPHEICAGASAGLALRGILVGEKFSDDSIKRVVLSPPTDVRLMNPVMQQVDDTVHFSSKIQSDQFHRSLDTMGYSVAASVKGGGRGFRAEAGFSKNHAKETKQESESHGHTCFESRVKYSVVPTSACELNPHNLKLSQDALHELKNLDKLFKGSENPDLRHAGCERFLRAYGSHINAGILHFGGVNKFVATYTSETKSESNKTKSMVRDALNAYASASYSGLGFSVAGSVSADHLETQGTFSSNYEKSEKSKTSLCTTRNGGPQEVSSLTLWKMGLVTCNSTWALIDRGRTLSTDFVGIWELIPNHEGDFSKPCELISTLRSVWEKMSGYTGTGDRECEVLRGMDRMDQLIENIATWNSSAPAPNKCIEYLQLVLKTVEEVEKETGSNNYWTDKLCTEKHIQTFLSQILEQQTYFSSRDVSMIRFLIRMLLAPTGHRGFPCKDSIMAWAQVTTESVDVPSILGTADIRNIPDLIKTLKEEFLPKLQIEHAKNTGENIQVSHSINAAATVDLALTVGHLVKCLGTSAHEVFFLKACLLPLNYHEPTMTFEALLTVDNIAEFSECLASSWRDFQLHQEKGIIQLEAFIIKLSLASSHFREKQEQAEADFSDLVKDVRQVMSPQVNKILNTYATYSPFSWVDLTYFCDALANGNMSVTEERKVDIGDLKEIFSSHDKSSEKDGPPQATVPISTAQDINSNILETLGLTKFYPSKISMLDAMVIKKTHQSPNLLDIPWMMLRKLLMIDFHARDHLILSVKESDSAPQEDFGLNDFLLGPHSNTNKDDATKLSTLDVLVTVFGCCDNFLKQTLAQKLFVCKLAIPFLYPMGSPTNITMSLWALRTIVVDWRDHQNEMMEVPVTDKPFPVVTFIRLGEPPLSKSKLINEMLSDNGHNTFFNRDCNNGRVDRRVSNGLVECSWFLSAGREKEHLPTSTMFLNLRGDATRPIFKQQMKVLQNISSVLFIIATARDLIEEQNTCTALQQILKSVPKAVLFLINGSCNQSMQHLAAERRACINAVGKDRLTGVWIISSRNNQGVQKNASELKIEVRRKLSEALTTCPIITTEKCAHIAGEEGIIIDEQETNCLVGKVCAQKMVAHMEGKNMVDCKQAFLPLQGAEWMEYCKLLKKQHRANAKSSQSSAAYQAEQMKQKMNRLREKQVEICRNELTPFIKDFMCYLHKYIDSGDTALYFLNWIKMLLDERSRTNLPGLRRRYHVRWAMFQEAKKMQDSDILGRLKEEVDDSEWQLASASLGLENLFRELGQIYEAVKENKHIGTCTRQIVEYLPEIAARLLLKGSSLELVDGDASSVPISWVTAVLEKLGNIIGGKKLFVLSVLGVQSSGKSTLLNTMFGLQFAVSAGRCTRGAHMQLVPVDKLADLPFDYVVVVDTEGLRAPELGKIKHDHDNELATLVIGLGDVTMINIKGENTAEMEDTLQIAVHAFLRMNLVSKTIKDHRTCIFVHQNVPAANAEQMMMHGCQKLQECLDEMAKEAAHSENIAHIDSFSQIIKFDVRKHVWFFSDLWHGNPPMAPANPGYSEKVDDVKLSLLKDIGKSKSTFLTTSDLSLRLADLWSAILADDFVFSFRNSLEVKAYNSLQSTYYALEWELQREVMTWVQKTAEIKIKRCENVQELDMCFQDLLVDLSNILISKTEDIKNRLKDYFENCNLQEIVVQWQQSKLNALEFAVEQRQNEGKADLLAIKEGCRIELMQKQKLAHHEMRIMDKAIELADKLKGKNIADTELKNKFNSMWVPMVQELATHSVEKVDRMDVLMENILRERFHAHGNILTGELTRHPLDLPLQYQSLEDSFNFCDVKREDISLKTGWKTELKKLNPLGSPSNIPELLARHKSVLFIRGILEEISIYLKNLCSQDVKFQRSNAIEVIQKLKEQIDNYNVNAHVSDDCTFTILPRCVIRLAVHVSRHCVEVFSLMQITYNKKHGVAAKLEEYRNTAWSLFKNTVKQSTEEVVAGDLVCTQLKGIIEAAVKKEIPMNCIDEVLRDFQMTKYYLIVKMMDDLACKGNFKEYETYINNARHFALKWITQYLNDKMFATQTDFSRYGVLTRNHIQRIIRCVAKSVEHSTSEVTGKTGTTMSLWLRKFCDKVSEEIAVPVSVLKHAGDRQVADFVNLQRIILNQLDEIKISLVGLFTAQTAESVKWEGTSPSQQVLDKIWGCPEQCPFCKEPCADTTAGHFQRSGRSHMCVQHRPTGIGGGRWDRDTYIDSVKVSKDQLTHECCNYYVQWENIVFNCRDCNFKCRDHDRCTTKGSDWVYHENIEYKTYLEEWDIAPDPTNSVSKYWMWFFATYQNQVKDMHRAQLPSIPPSWFSITRDEALTDLRKVHN